MSRARRLPAIPAAALRDYDSSERLPAVWRRLKSDLGQAGPSARRSPLLWAWVPALTVVLFGSGVFVGARFVRPQALPGLQAEPRAQSVRAAGPAPAANAAGAEAQAPLAKALHAPARHAINLGALPSEPLAFRPSESGAS